MTQDLANTLDSLAKSHLELKLQILDQRDEINALHSALHSLPLCLTQLVQQCLEASKSANKETRKTLEDQLEVLRQGATRQSSKRAN